MESDVSPVCVATPIDIADESYMSLICEQIGDNMDSALQLYALSGQNAITGPDNRPLIPAKPDAVCHKCKLLGHFSRDCPQLHGSGKSWIGQRDGTADGFRKDQPRPAWFLEQQQKRRPQIAAIRTASTSGGTGATYARNQRRTAATQPTHLSYQHMHTIPHEWFEDYMLHYSDVDRMLPTESGL